MTRRYARAYVAKYAATFDKPPATMCHDDVEWIARRGFDYGPEAWKLIRAYSTRSWTDMQGRDHFVIDKRRMPEIEEAVGKHIHK